MDEDHVGIRVRRWRLRRGLSQRALAELAGFTQGYIGQIETGATRLEKRTSRMAIAQALQISVTELSGVQNTAAPYRPPGAARSIPDLRASLALLSWPTPDLFADEPATTARDADLTAVVRHYHACRYDLLVPALADVVTDLAHRWRSPTSAGHPGVLQDLVVACFIATATCDYLGYDDLGLFAAEQCRKAADTLAEPAFLGVANAALIRSCFDWERAGYLADRGIDLLSAPARRDSQAVELCGIHHLMAAAVAAHERRHAGVFAHLEKARHLADRAREATVRPFLFGPMKVALWELGIMVQLGAGGRARILDAEARPPLSPSRYLQASYHIQSARGWLQSRGGESEAVSALLRAEAIAPQLTRVADASRAAVRTLLMRPRAGRSQDLRNLAGRAGLAD